MASRTQPGPPRQEGSKKRDFAKTLWIYQKEGRDIGPFRPPEIKDLLKKGEVGASTLVRESASMDWHEIRTLKAFVQYLEELKEEARFAEREKELDAHENRVRGKRKMPFLVVTVLALGALGAGGWYGWTLWKNREGIGPSGYSRTLLRNLELPKLQPLGYLDTSGPIQWADEDVKVRKVKTDTSAEKRQKRRNGAKSIGDEASDAAPVSDLSFAEGDGPRGDPPSSHEVQVIGSRVESRLRSCASAEAARGSSAAIRVRVWILPSGHLKASSGGASGAFAACARRAVQGVTVPPFDGTAVSFEVEFGAAQ